jgi:hypothetical protein
VQNGCLVAIWECERRGKQQPPTTFDIAAHIYHISPDADGAYCVTDAEHVAVKRALEGLQRQGRVIGLRMRHDERCFRWMSEKRAQQWVREQRPEWAKRIRAKMRTIGTVRTSGGVTP